ncbi:MAG TPA: pilus assembly protein PilN [Gammaproteobacteria bacterium]|nr:pilus assembly protein PilN [Gammaproteobacteria bacterium]HCO44345.1 pilus assembly protein PilN [Gammaproteobacteria bacterium]HCZ49137.1 pilus assembly protein PilN [Gammaproteobacteria bacterium]MCH78575.1 pilus assembly protein PilN [Gammaproteobacteria bacterium]
MSRVNLLPWRRLRRQRRQNEFIAIAGAAAVAAVLVVAAWELLATMVVNNQEDRNNVLRAEIAELDIKIREIRDIQAKKAKLQARMDVIQELQVKRPASVKLFDALARSTPEGAFLTNFSQRDTTLSLRGWAQSNARVSTYMNQLDASDQFDPSQLLVVRAGEYRGIHASQFDLRVPQHIAKNESEQ